jgi:hypothetical protein
MQVLKAYHAGDSSVRHRARPPQRVLPSFSEGDVDRGQEPRLLH